MGISGCVVSTRPSSYDRVRASHLQTANLNPVMGDGLPESHQGACAVADVVDAEDKFQLIAISLCGQWEVLPDGSMEASG
jgi:hypothetical protein